MSKASTEHENTNTQRQQLQYSNLEVAQERCSVVQPISMYKRVSAATC